MSSRPQDEQEEQEEQAGSQISLGRIVKIALLIFGLAIGGVAIGALFAGESTNLPFDYEGFD